MLHFIYVPILGCVGLIFAGIYAVADKIIAKTSDKTKRKYVKIATFAVLILCMGCICSDIFDWCKQRF
jgi:hypothetical protein